MKLSRLLQEHREAAPAGSTPTNFGDGYLVAHNRIYSAIRAASLANGFRLSDDRNDAYAALPLSQLDSLLTRKTLPYVNNVSVLEEIEAVRPGVVEWDDIRENFRRNHLFHESGHAVARPLADSALGKIEAPAGPEEQKLAVVRMLLEESFANTCELLGVIDASDAVHRVFYEANSYTYLFAERSNLRNAFETIGGELLGRCFILAYLHANFLRPTLGDKEFERVIRVALGPDAAPDAKALKALRALLKIASRLDPDFRNVTTAFYFRMNGLQRRMEELLAFDFMDAVENDARFGRLTMNLAKIFRT